MSRRVYTGGTFDLFHPGHVQLLRSCRRLAGVDGSVVVGLNTDGFVAEFKGEPPVVPFADRRAVLCACRYVDQVYDHRSGPDSKPTILSAFLGVGRGERFVAIGQDWCRTEPPTYYDQMGFTPEWLEEEGIELVYIARTTPHSSTRIRQRLL